MTRIELTTVPDFTIWNEHGSIKFITPPGKPGLDLTTVDLGRDITILPRRISVYDDLPSDVTKPLPNTKLNVPSIITLNRVVPRKGQTPQQQEDKLRKSLEDGNTRNSEDNKDMAEFIFYDHQTYEWVFKVPHYTTWGDSEEEEEAAIQPMKGIEEESMEMTEDEAQRSGSEIAAKAAAVRSGHASESLKKKKSVTDAGLSAPVFETLSRPEQMEGQVLQYGSPAYQRKYGNNEQIILKGAIKRLEAAAEKEIVAPESKVILTRK